MPAGASCAVSSSGVVTVLAPAERRRYLLEPAASDEARSASAPPSAPSGAEIGSAASQLAANGSPMPSSAPPRDDATAALSPTLPAPPAQLVQPSARAAFGTLGYSPERAEALRREFDLARARSFQASEPPAPREAFDGRSPAVSEWPPRTDGNPLPSSPNASPIQEARRAEATTPADASESARGLEPVRRSSLPAPAAALRNVARPSAEIPKPRALGSTYGLGADGLTLLAARDLDPTSSSPLTYRERAYLLTGTSDRVRLEVLLQAELACLRRELAGRPRGQFVRLGVFREPFDGKPTQPPIATLEWKDWRGRAVFQLAEDATVEGAPMGGFPSEPPPGPAARDLDRAANAEAPFPSAAASAPRELSPFDRDVFAPAASAAAGPHDSDPFGPPGPAPARSSSFPPLTAAASPFGVAIAPPFGSPPPQPIAPPPFGAIAPQQPAATPFGAVAPAQPVVAPPFGVAAPQPPITAPPFNGSAQPQIAPPFGSSAPQPQVAAPPFGAASPALSPAPAPNGGASRPSSLPPPASNATPVARSSSLPPPPSKLAAAVDLRANEPLHFSEPEERNSEPDTRLAAAFESMPDLHMLPTPVTGLEFTIELLSQLVPCEAISGCLYDIETDEFRFVALSGLGALERKACAVRASLGLFGAAARGREESLLVVDVAAEPRYVEAVDARPGIATRNLAYIPVRHHGQLLGMLQLINRDLPRGFSASDSSVLTYVAGQLGEFLSNCRALVV